MTGYPIEWRGQTLMLGELTIEVKEAFCNWLRPRLLKHAKRLMEPMEYLNYRESLIASEASSDDDDEEEGGILFWTTKPSMSVATAFSTRRGAIYLNRLLFGDGVKDWTDAQIWELIKAKDKDPDSDYRIAWDLIWDTQDPKAQKGSEPSPVPTVTADSSESSVENRSRELAAKLLAN